METLEQARHIAMDEGLHYVYLGNVRPDHEGNNTYCPKCKNLVIQRKGLFVVQNNVVDGKCNKCKNEIPGVWF
jgi:pyruvate formate lyase activating enzyme